MTDFRTLLGVAYDTKKANEELNTEIKKLQKITKIELDVDLSDTEAKNSINKLNKLWSNYRKESVASITAPNTELKKMSNYYKNLENDIQSELQTKKKYYLDELNAYRINEEMKRKEADETARAIRNASNLEFDKTQLDGGISLFLKNNTRLGAELRTELLRVQQETRNADSVKLDSLQKQFKNVKLEAEVTGQTGATFFTKLKTNAMQFTNFLSSATLVMSGINTIKGMVKEVKNLDASYVDLQQATGKTRKEVGLLMDTYFELGKELKATATDIADAAANWLRQGKTIAETNMLIRDSMVLSKIGQIDSANATTYLTTAMKGYGVAASEVSGIVDKLSAVDMASATSVAGLAEGMSEVATNANLAGVSMDKLLGYLAVIGETTGEGMSSVGNSVSSMFSRMGNIKLARLSDYQNNGEDLSNVETVLRGLGIELRESNNEFKNFGVVLDQTSSKWNSLDGVTQRAIASSIAGRENMEQFLILMENYGTATRYAEVSINSAGTAMEKFAAYEDSVAAKTERLTNSFQQLSSNTIDSSWVKGFLDLANVLVGVIDKLGIFNIAIISLAGVLGSKTGLGLNALSQLIMNLTSKMGVATVASTALGTVLSTMLPVAAILAGVTLIVKAYDHFNVTLEEQKEKYEDSIVAYEQTSEALKSIKTELDSTSTKIDELNNKESLTFVEEQELERLKKITEELLIQEDILSKQGKTDAKNMAKETVKTFKQQYSNSNFTNEQVQSYVKGSDISGNNALLFNDEGDIPSLIAAYIQIGKLKEEAFNDKDLDSVQNYNDAIDDISSTLNSNILDLTNLKSTLEDVPFDELTEEQKKSLTEINNAIDLIYENIDPNKWKQIKFDSLVSTSDSDVQNSIDKLKELSIAGKLSPEVINSTDEYSKLLKESGLTAEDVSNQINAMTESSKNVVNSNETLESSYSKLAKGVDEVTGYVNDLGENVDISKLKESIDGTISSIQELTSILDDMDTDGGLSSDNLNKLIQNYPQLLSYIGDEDELRKQLQTTIDNQKQKTEEYYRSMLELDTNLYTNIINNNANKVNKLNEYYDIDLSNYKSLAQAKNKVETSLLSSVTKKWADFYNAQATAAEITNRSESSFLNSGVWKAAGGDKIVDATISNFNKHVEVLKNKAATEQIMYGQIKDLFLNTDYTSSIVDTAMKSSGIGKDKKDFSKEYNWISILKENIATALGGLDNLLNYSQKNTQIDLALTAKLDEEKSLKEIQNSYLSLANKVKLPEKYKQLVNNGALKVESITDEALANQIDEYTKWRDAAKDVGKELETISDDLKELNGLKLDNIKSHFDLRNSYTDSKINKRNSLITSKEASGGSASKSDYTYLQKLYGDIIVNLDKEYKAYETLFNDQVASGIIKKGSTEYYEGLSYLNELTIATRETNIEIDELANKKIQLTFVDFDKEIDSINSQLSELDTMTSFLDPNSIEQITLYQTGLAIASNHTKELTSEINSLNKSFEKGAIPETIYKERLSELQTQMNSNAKTIKSYQDAIISSMKNRYDDELKLSDKTLKDELKNLEKLKKAKVSALNEELKKYKEIIDIRKKALKDAADEEDYRDEVDDYTKKISNLESKINSLKSAEKTGDLSGRQERLNAEDELADLKKDLGKIQRDYTIENATDALDAEYDEYEKVKNTQISDTEEFYDLQIENAQSVYDLKASQLEELYKNERQLIIDAAQLTSDEFAKAFGVINTTLSSYGITVSSDLTNSYNNLGEGFTNNTASSNSLSKILGAKSESNKYNQDTSNLSGLNNYLAKQGYKAITTKQMVELAQALNLNDITSASQLGTDEIGKLNKDRIKKALKNARFSEGGIIGKGSINAMGEDGVILARKNEAILKEEQWKLLRTVVNTLQQVDTSKYSSIESLKSNNLPTVNINLPANTTIDKDAIDSYMKYTDEAIKKWSDALMNGKTRY